MKYQLNTAEITKRLNELAIPARERTTVTKIGYTTWQNIKRGKHNASLHTISKLCTAFKCKWSDVVEVVK